MNKKKIEYFERVFSQTELDNIILRHNEGYEHLLRYYIAILGIDRHIVLREFTRMESGDIFLALWNGDLELSQTLNPELFSEYDAAISAINYFIHHYEGKRKQMADNVREITLASGVKIHVSNENEA